MPANGRVSQKKLPELVNVPSYVPKEFLTDPFNQLNSKFSRGSKFMRTNAFSKNGLTSPLSVLEDRTPSSKQVDVYHLMAIDDVANYKRENKMKKDARVKEQTEWAKFLKSQMDAKRIKE